MDDIKSSKDEDLVVHYKAGKERAFDELFLRYAVRIKRLIYFYIGDMESAEDIFQEVFIRVYRHIDKFNIHMTFSSWIYQIAINCSKNYIKKNKQFDAIIDREKFRVKDIENTIDTPEEQIIKEMDIKEFNRAIETLGIKFKDVFVLRFDQKMKYQEIADILNCSERTAKWRMKKSIQIIVQHLKDKSII